MHQTQGDARRLPLLAWLAAGRDNDAAASAERQYDIRALSTMHPGNDRLERAERGLRALAATAPTFAATLLGAVRAGEIDGANYGIARRGPCCAIGWYWVAVRASLPDGAAFNYVDTWAETHTRDTAALEWILSPVRPGQTPADCLRLAWLEAVLLGIIGAAEGKTT